MSKEASSAPTPDNQPPSSALPDDPQALLALLLAERRVRHEERERHGAVVATMAQTISEQQRKLDRQEQRIAQLLKQFYGPKRERFHPDQLTFFDADELAALAAEATPTGNAPSSAAKRQRKGHGRRPLPDHLRRETIVHELSSAERCCPTCGEQRSEIDRERSEQLEYIPPQYKVLVHERIKYACRACQEQVAIAAKPPQPIEKGLPGPGLLAHTVLAKYGDHSPLYREEDKHSRHGVLLRRSTLCDWIAAAADLADPLYQRMRQLVLLSRIIQTDDTTVKLLDALLDHARTARFWAYLGDVAHPYTVYDFTDSRKRDGPAEFLQGFQGYLQADAYGGYDGIYSSGAVVEVACWAHARRKWHDARTTDPVRGHHALALTQRLYQLEEEWRDLEPAARQAARQEHALPILTEFRAWLDAESPKLLPKSPIGQAATYALNQWAALVRYCENGALSIDNNASERAMKAPALGRKNWLFVASKNGGRRAAILFSLIASCKRNQVEPWAWLRDVFSRLPSLPANTPEHLDPLLPDRWIAEHPQHRWEIDALRKQARRAHAAK
jgi:transposase